VRIGIVYCGSVVLQGVGGIEDAGKLLVNDLNEVDSLLGGLLVDSRDSRDLVADKSDLIPAEGILIRELLERLGIAKLAAVEILARDDALYAGQRLGFGGVDAYDLGMGIRAAFELSVEHAGKNDVFCVLGSARDLVFGVYAGVALACKFVVLGLFINLFQMIVVFPVFRSFFCHFYTSLSTSAAAEIASTILE